MTADELTDEDRALIRAAGEGRITISGRTYALDNLETKQDHWLIGDLIHDGWLFEELPSRGGVRLSPTAKAKSQALR